MNPVLLSLTIPTAKLSGQRQRVSAQQYEFKFQHSSTVRANVAPMIPGLAVDFLLQELLAKHDPPPVEVAGVLRCESLEQMSQISNSCDLQIHHLPVFSVQPQFRFA